MALAGWMELALAIAVSLGGAAGALLLLRMLWLLLRPEDF
jgi:hypothetical protein